MALEIGEGRDRERFAAVIKEVRIALIRYKEDAAFPAKFRNAPEFLVIQNGSAGIIRRIHHDHARAWRERASKKVGGQAKAVGFLRVEENRVGIDEPGDIAERHPVGRRDDDVIAFIDDSFENVEQGVLASEINDAFGDVVLRSEVARMLFDYSLLQFLDAADGRVLREVLLNCADARLLHVIGSGKIRLTGAEVNDVNALLPQLDRRFHNSHGFGY